MIDCPVCWWECKDTPVCECCGHEFLAEPEFNETDWEEFPEEV